MPRKTRDFTLGNLRKFSLSEAKNLAYLRSFADQRRPSVDGARSVPVRMTEMTVRNRDYSVFESQTGWRKAELNLNCGPIAE
jgi:hypothetical protein